MQSNGTFLSGQMHCKQPPCTPWIVPGIRVGVGAQEDWTGDLGHHSSSSLSEFLAPRQPSALGTTMGVSVSHFGLSQDTSSRGSGPSHPSTPS